MSSRIQQSSSRIENNISIQQDIPAAFHLDPSYYDNRISSLEEESGNPSCCSSISTWFQETWTVVVQKFQDFIEWLRTCFGCKNQNSGNVPVDADDRASFSSFSSDNNEPHDDLIQNIRANASSSSDSNVSRTAFLQLSSTEIEQLLTTNPFEDPLAMQYPGEAEAKRRLFAALKHIYAHETQAALELVRSLTPAELSKSTYRHWHTLFDYAMDAGEYVVAWKIFEKTSEEIRIPSKLDYLSSQLSDPIQREIIDLHKEIFGTYSMFLREFHQQTLQTHIDQIFASQQKEDYFSRILQNRFLTQYLLEKGYFEHLKEYVHNANCSENFTVEEMLNALPLLKPEDIHTRLNRLDLSFKVSLLNQWISNENCTFKDLCIHAKQTYLDPIVNWDPETFQEQMVIRRARTFAQSIDLWNLAAAATDPEMQKALLPFLKLFSEIQLKILIPALPAETFCQVLPTLETYIQHSLIRAATQDQKLAYLDSENNSFVNTCLLIISQIEDIQNQVQQNTLDASQYNATAEKLGHFAASLTLLKQEFGRLERALKANHSDPSFQQKISQFVENLSLTIDREVSSCKTMQEILRSGISQDRVSEEQNSDEFICGISLDIMEDPVVTPCGHYFDRENILNWMNNGNGANTHLCPNCRSQIDENSLAAPSQDFLRRLNLWKSNHSS